MMEIDLSSGNVQLAEYILKGETIIKYLRKKPTVGLAKVPVRDTNGTILKDVPWKKKRVICSGIPFGCLIGFTLKKQLFIGWSKRLELEYLPETDQLHELFKNIIKVIYDPKMADKKSTEEGAMENYKDLFSIFADKLTSFVTNNETKDVEIAFSKKIGKMTAIIRGLSDVITFDGKKVTSLESGVIPSEIANKLREFTDAVEAKFGMKAININREGNTAVGAVMEVGLPMVSEEAA